MKILRIVCAGPPSHKNQEFIEIEDEDWKSIGPGEWRSRDDGYWEYFIDMHTMLGLGHDNDERNRPHCPPA